MAVQYSYREPQTRKRMDWFFIAALFSHSWVPFAGVAEQSNKATLSAVTDSIIRTVGEMVCFIAPKDSCSYLINFCKSLKV